MYRRIGWPESQALMELDDEQMDELGIEFGEDCSYFVPEDAIDELREKYGIYV
jgi:hypothetical protein